MNEPLPILACPDPQLDQPVVSSEHPAGAEVEGMVMHLERDQLVAETDRPLPRVPLSPRAQLALWVLRIVVLLVSAMVIYAFVAQL